MADSVNIIGVLSGIAGSLITQGFTVALARRKSNAALSLLVARVAIRLEQFADQCAAVAEDWGDYDFLSAHEQPEARPKSTEPTFSVEGENVDWSVLNSDTLKQLLRLARKAEDAAAAVATVGDIAWDPPDHDAYFETRTQAFAIVGLEACALAAKLERELRSGVMTRLRDMLLYRPDAPEIVDRRARLQTALDEAKEHEDTRRLALKRDSGTGTAGLAATASPAPSAATRIEPARQM